MLFQKFYYFCPPGKDKLPDGKINMRKVMVKRVIIIVMIVVAGIFSAAFFKNESKDFKLVKNLDIYYSLFRELNAFYVDDIDPDKLVKTSIDEMLKILDPYTIYYSEQDIDDFQFMTTGKYGGIGSLIRRRTYKSGKYYSSIH